MMTPPSTSRQGPAARLLATGMLLGLCVVFSGCVAPIGAERTTPALAYRQTHDNPVSRRQPSAITQSTLHRFQQNESFKQNPDETLQLLHQKAVDTKERSLLFVLCELNYLAGESMRRSVKAWEHRDPRDYYLASAVYAWLFLLGDAGEAQPAAFDQKFRTACDIYNYGLGWALMDSRRSTNTTVKLAGGLRSLPLSRIEVQFDQSGFPWQLEEFDEFVAADRFVVRGLSVRNRQPGLGAPLIAVTKPNQHLKLPRSVPATVLLRVKGDLADLDKDNLRASLELYSCFDDVAVRVGDRTVPLETDTTVPIAYSLNQTWVWKLGMRQFFSAEERIPSGVYTTQPYQPGRVPVVLVHGTFSSPVWWAEMANALSADPVLRRRCQFWFFIYNSGNPIVYSAEKLRETLKAKVQELDPEGRDVALQHMVVVGHSQGGLLTKLTGTDTGHKLLHTLVKTNNLESLKLSPEELAKIEKFCCYDSLPFVKRAVFISTPHRGSYLAGGFVRRLARKFVTMPTQLVKRASELAGLGERLGIPRELRGVPTSLDGMSPRNPFLLALAGIPLAPGVKGHSIIAVEGNGDYHHGKDGLVTYQSAHVDYVESEFIVRSFHSCQDKPPTIEEVRRILHEHLRELPPTKSN